MLDSVVLRDVVTRHRIRDVPLLERLLTFVLANLGQVFSARRVSDFLKSQRRSLGAETVYNYLAALSGAALIHQVGRYDLAGKRVLETGEKVFVADHSFASAMLGPGADNLPGVLENMVFIEALRRGYRVNIGRQGSAEVYFVCASRGTRVYIQVAYLLSSSEVVEREFKPLRAIDDNHPKYVVTLDDLPAANADGIRREHLADFLLRDW